MFLQPDITLRTMKTNFKISLSAYSLIRTIRRILHKGGMIYLSFVLSDLLTEKCITDRPVL